MMPSCTPHGTAEGFARAAYPRIHPRNAESTSGMPSPTRLIAIASLVFALPPSRTRTQSFQSFQPRYTTVTNGDMVLLSNTNMTCATPSGGSCAAANSKHDNPVMINGKLPVDAADASILCSSGADLTSANLPAGAQVVKAILYWGRHVVSRGGAPSPNRSGITPVPRTVHAGGAIP